MLKIDLHIHTIASGHAYNTILEYVTQAKKLKMKVVGISDHGPSLEGTTTNDIYFKTLSRLPLVIDGVRVLKGIEANIIDQSGKIDLDDKVVVTMDYVMASLHPYTPYKDKGSAGNTKAIINAIKGGKIDIITHPTLDKYFPYSVKEVCEAACQHDVLLELNLSSLSERLVRGNTMANMKLLVDTVKKHGQKLIVNSDSHSIWELADDSALTKIKKQLGLTDQMIINNHPKELFEYLGLSK